MSLPKVDLTRWHMPSIRVSVWRAPLDTVELTVSLNVRSATSAEMITVHSHIRIEDPHDPAELKRFIRRHVLMMLEHELDETLYIDGERLCANPHPNGQNLDYNFSDRPG